MLGMKLALNKYTPPNSGAIRIHVQYAGLAFLILTSPLASQSFRPSTTTDFLPNTPGKENYSETWSYQISLGGNKQIHVELSVIKKGGDNHTTANLFVIGFRGRNHSVTCQYPADKYLKSKLSVQRVEVFFHKNIYFKGNDSSHQLKFYREKNNTAYWVDLKFSELWPGVALAEPVPLKNGNTLGFSIPFPHARVAGRIAVNNDTLAVNGSGYVDHIYQSGLATDNFSGGLRYFGVGNNIDVGFVFAGSKKSHHQVVGLSVKFNNNTPAIQAPTALDKAANAIGFGKFSLEFSGIKALHRWRLLDEMPKGFGGAVGLFVKNVTVTRCTGYSKDDKRYMFSKIEID